MTEQGILLKKAHDASIIYDYLASNLGITDLVDTTFLASIKAKDQLTTNYLKENPFPNFIALVLAKLRKEAVNKLFEEEKVLQTPVIVAVLSLISSLATNIGKIRGDDVKDAKIYTDVSYAGLQAIRLYMANYTNKEFKKARLNSALKVDNAINGSFYKYKTKDGRFISFHTYYQSQQEKLCKALKLKKESSKFSLLSTRKDKKYLASVVKEYDSFELEDLAFASGACASILRTREEWENTEVGKAVKEMPLITFKNQGTFAPCFGTINEKGPLSGIKVLDLTHIIAGPAATRILAEYGADVLLVRRKTFMKQEQAMLELDGWAGKNSIQLDLNIEDEKKKMIELIKEANVIVFSYQNNCFDKFGLSKEEIRKINPSIIYANLMCFSTTEWVDRPGWAPLAEDITGLSIRNGSEANPKNLNGVPLDYIPGFILALGVMMALKKQLLTNEVSDVTTSLTRGAVFLHEATDMCANNQDEPKIHIDNFLHESFNKPRVYVQTAALGKIGFPHPATYNTRYNNLVSNMDFSDGNQGFSKK